MFCCFACKNSFETITVLYVCISFLCDLGIMIQSQWRVIYSAILYEFKYFLCCFNCVVTMNRFHSFIYASSTAGRIVGSEHFIEWKIINIFDFLNEKNRSKNLINFGRMSMCAIQRAFKLLQLRL